MLLQNRLFRSAWTAWGWLVLITFLFCLPGSALPKSGFFTKIHLDKWVHTGLFGILYFLFRGLFPWKLNFYTISVLLFCLLYGVLIEFVQDLFITNRSFDFYDILADAAGVILGLLVWLRVYKKNKPL